MSVSEGLPSLRLKGGEQLIDLQISLELGALVHAKRTFPSLSREYFHPSLIVGTETELEDRPSRFRGKLTFLWLHLVAFPPSCGSTVLARD